MRPYEVMVILDAGLEEDAIRPILDRIGQIVTNGGGTVAHTDRWGKRRFAYELKHRWDGYYVVVEISAEPATVSELDRMLFLADEVIRHKTIRLPAPGAGRSTRPTAEPEPAAAEAS